MSQSKGAITSGQQLLYLSEWFTEMSEMQSQDFMKYLLNKYGNCGQQSDNNFINGFNQLGVSDRPASIFQCRMKLFSEWFAQWSDEEKQELLVRLRNINSQFMDEFQANIDSISNSQTTTGATDDVQLSQQINGNIDDDSKSTEHLTINGQHLDEESPEPESQPEVTDDNNEIIGDQSPETDSHEVVEVIKEEFVKISNDESVVSVNESNEVQEVCG